MLTAHPRSWLSWDFLLMKDGKLLSAIDLSSWRERGTLSVEKVPCRVYREGLCSGAFVLESNGIVVARAVKPSAWTRRMLIDAGGAQFELKPQSAFTRGFRLMREEKTIGTLSATSMWNRKMHVDLPDEIPLVIRSFMVWLTVMLWRRDANAAG